MERIDEMPVQRRSRTSAPIILAASAMTRGSPMDVEA
jgi:hypothetical protein